MNTYDEIFKSKIIKLHLEDNRSINSLSKEFGVAIPTISKWVLNFRLKSNKTTESENIHDCILENQKLHKQIDELEEILNSLIKTLSYLIKKV